MTGFAIGSLFSGVGGLELGLEWAGLGPVLWQVEIDPKARAVLAHHWPNAERFEDVRTVGAATLVPVDLICGGFPCQDVSSAGKGAGLDGARSGLWREYARVVRELRPRWVVVENVAGAASRWVDAVRADLGGLGYASLPIPLAASDVGAPHRRERVFIVAADTRCERGFWEQGRRGTGRPVPAEPDRAGATRGTAADAHADREHALAEHAEVAIAPATADASEARRQGSGPSAHASRLGPAAVPGWSPQPGLVPVVHGLSGGMAGRIRRARIRALGNAVVPQCAEVVGWVIRELSDRAATGVEHACLVGAEQVAERVGATDAVAALIGGSDDGL